MRIDRAGLLVLCALTKGAATTVITQLVGHPLHTDYHRRLEASIKANLVKLTLARHRSDRAVDVEARGGVRPGTSEGRNRKAVSVATGQGEAAPWNPALRKEQVSLVVVTARAREGRLTTRSR